jgi:uncharacterized membrane protein YdjX (TVP38/TMEM64 family)
MTSGDPIENLEGGKRANAIRMLVITVLAIACVAYLMVHDMKAIHDFISDNGALGLVVSILVYGALGATLVPTEPLTILIGAAFNPLIATIAATLGNLLAALIEYYLGHRISNASNFMKMREKLPFGLGKLPMTSPVFLIFARMVPGYGSKLVSVLCGMYHIPIGLYIWTTLIPTFLGAVIFAYGGFGVLQLFHFR